jgi:anti-sigma factor RsiW
MNEHQIWDELLQDYLDGSLSEADRPRFEAHLQNCETCRQVIANTERLRAHLRDDSAPHLTPERRLRLYERLNAERAARGEPLLRVPQALLDAAAQSAASGAEAMGEMTAEAARSAAEAASAAGQADLPKAAESLAKGGAKVAATGSKGMLGMMRNMLDAAQDALDPSKDEESDQ